MRWINWQQLVKQWGLICKRLGIFTNLKSTYISFKCSQKKYILFYIWSSYLINLLTYWHGHLYPNWYLASQTTRCHISLSLVSSSSSPIFRTSLWIWSFHLALGLPKGALCHLVDFHKSSWLFSPRFLSMSLVHLNLLPLITQTIFTRYHYFTLS